MGSRKRGVSQRESEAAVIEERKLDISEDDDREQMMEALMHLKSAADIIIEQAEKRGAKLVNKDGELIVPFDLDENIKAVIIKEYVSETKH